MNSNYAYMHHYCSKMIYLHTSTPTDVGIFWPKMCIYNHFLYFKLTDVSALTCIDVSALGLFENYLAPLLSSSYSVVIYLP